MNAVTVIEADSDRPQLWLDVPKGQSFEDWCATGEKLQRTGHVLNWWIGDWWAAGNHRYGERAKAAAEGIFGKEFGTLANAASVCRAFETSRRREALSWSHHVEVASLPPEEADALLDKAQTEDISRADFRIQAMQRKVALGLFRARDIDPDAEYKWQKARASDWNRVDKAWRVSMFELYQEAAENDFGVIEV